MTTELEITDMIVRQNSLINATIRLDAKEYDLVRTFMKYIKRNDSDFWTFSVLAGELNINKSRCKTMVRNIQRKPLEIDLPDNGLISIPFFTMLKYHNGIFEGKFNNDLKEVLLDISKDFTKTYERYILPMDSIYAKRLYELLIENLYIGYRKFNLEKLYDIFAIKKSMRKYANFKKKVLVISIREINKHTDIYISVNINDLTDISWIKLQCGKQRSITHLNFEFRKKDKNNIIIQRDTMVNEQNVTRNDILKTLDYELIIDESVGVGADALIVKQRIEKFINYCLDKQKRYKNYYDSYYMYLEIALQNNWTI